VGWLWFGFNALDLSVPGIRGAGIDRVLLACLPVRAVAWLALDFRDRSVCLGGVDWALADLRALWGACLDGGARAHPQSYRSGTLCGLADRTQGFDPNAYSGTVLPVWAGVALRFLRLVITVPLVEELCWRGFVMRLIDDPDRPFTENPFGHHRWRIYGVVTALVVLAHQPVDWFGSLVFGSLAYLIAIRTKSLGACVIFHAVVNLLLGISVMATRQWGFW